jgi:hypothetical protein
VTATLRQRGDARFSCHHAEVDRVANQYHCMEEQRFHESAQGWSLPSVRDSGHGKRQLVAVDILCLRRLLATMAAAGGQWSSDMDCCWKQRCPGVSHDLKGLKVA